MKNFLIYALIGLGVITYNVSTQADRDGAGAQVPWPTKKLERYRTFPAYRAHNRTTMKSSRYSTWTSRLFQAARR
jgi:hypothetical protein